MLLNERDLDEMRRQVLEAFDYWAPKLACGEINDAQIDLRGYRGPGERVRSQGQIDPQRSARIVAKLTAMK